MCVERTSFLPEYHGRCYRGVFLDPTDYSVGTSFVWKSFNSSSKLIEKAKHFVDKIAQGVNNGKPLLFIIDSKSGRDISNLSFYSGEEEVIFAPGTTFTVLQVIVQTIVRKREPKGRWRVYHIYMIET